MAEGSTKKDIQISIGKDLSTVVIGGTKVEVGSDGKKVTAYTNDGVETRAAAAPGETAAKGTQISISEDFNTVVLSGVTIERAADGHLVISAPGTVITKPGPANDTAAKGKTAPEIGDKMEDGTVYAGISPDTNRPMYATPADAPLTYTFNQAQKYAEKLDAHGHKDWRAPTKGELNVLFQHRAAIGGFNETGSDPAGWYWSSSPGYDVLGWAQRFSYGYQNGYYRGYASSLPCVR
jgi:hypothetical protein